MSEKDTKMLSSQGDNIGEKILSILNRVTYPMTKDSDCKSMEKCASSPDSAIDLTEDNKHLGDIPPAAIPNTSIDISSFALEILDSVIEDVIDASKRRERKKKREKFSDSEKWNLIKQESTIGWKRILSRNTDEEGGWGFNFISPKGLKLTIKELEKFLKKKKLDIDDLVFEAHKIELHSYPRKKATLKMGYPLDKIRDLKLPKKLELERKRKLAQMRQANQPTFKSISEFLASLDQSDGQIYDRDIETDEDTETELDKTQDSSFNISVESVSEEYGHCSHILEEILHNVVMLSSRPSLPLISPNTRIKSLEKNMAEVQQTLSSMLQNSSTPKTVEKLKIKINDRVSSKPQTPVKIVTEIERLKCSKIKISPSPVSGQDTESSCDSTSNTPKIEKLKITPERLKEKRPSLTTNDYVSELNTPTSLKIRNLSGSPERTTSKPKGPKTQSLKKETKKPNVGENKKPKKSAELVKAQKSKKFSIFKTRNKESRDENAVSFTDKTVGKSLSIRRSSKDTESKGANGLNEPLTIDIDDDRDEDIDDEFTQAAAKPLESPHSKMTVVQQHSTAPVTVNPPVKRNIFGPHSPVCRDEISPEKSESQKIKSESCDTKLVSRPASRTQSRVLSNEDAIKAIDAVVNLSEVEKKSQLKQMSLEASTMPSPSLLSDRSKQSTPVSLSGATPTPSLPQLSPQDDRLTDSHSNMTTPSLPSLSPAIRHGSSVPSSMSSSPTLPCLSPALPRRPEGILPRRQPPIIQQMDPSKSAPLSVEIPPNHISSFNSSQSSGKSIDQNTSDNSKAPINITTTPKPKKVKVNESPIERSATGRRMRDCRKFIHYEFSPPFASSESSVSEIDSPENRKENFIKKLDKKKMRMQRTQSMTEECLSSPNSVSSNPVKKRGRPVKSKSTDCREEVIVLDDDSNASTEVFEEKKKKRGRPPKKKLLQEENSRLSISEMAESLTENQISPITREKLVFPLSSPNTEERKAKLISQQRESLMLRRNSDDNKKAARKAKKIARSKSMDVSQNLDTSKVEDLSQLKKNMNELDFNQLLLRNAEKNKNTPIEPLQTPCQPVNEVLIESEAGPSTKLGDNNAGTLIVRKSVRVQDYADPLMTIRDQLSKNSPPPQLINETSEARPMTPPPGPCTIYQENLDLVDGLRVLTKVGPHFYPGYVKTIESPSIFAVTVDGERGNKPHIYSAEELLEKTILEVKPKSCRYTPLGTRVCVFWSNKLNFLYPGTVKNVYPETQYVSIKLDDGDEREININNVRLLPKGYPKVVCKDKESPIGVVEANTISPVAVSAIQFVKSPTEKKVKENEFDEENALLKLKSSGQTRKLSAHKLFNSSSSNSEEKNKKVAENSKELSTSKTSSNDTRDPTLNDEYLKDGMRILTIKDGHFYPGRLNATRPPDIYGVLFDNERGFRPVIYAREQLLKDSVREMKVKSTEVAEGTRVCVYWSSKYQYLHPATVIPHNDSKHNEKYLNVVLDDGDTREIHMDQIRLLPPNFPKVVYSEDNPSPRKKSSSRPSSRADTPRSSSCVSDNSRPSSSLSNFSDTPKITDDSDRDSSIKSPLSPMKMVNGTTPPLSRDSTPLGSPVPNKNHPKVFIPEPPSKPQTFDLVGMISSGIDKLVDKKKVVGSRPSSGYNPMMPRPGDNMTRPPMMQSPHPNMPSPHYMMSPNPYAGYQSPHPYYNHPPPSPYPNGPSPPPTHYPSGASPPHYPSGVPPHYPGGPQYPPNYQGGLQPPPPPPNHVAHPPSVSPPPPSSPSSQTSPASPPTCNGDSKISDSDNKAKSRLSNLIQAMSGKIKQPETPASPADQILNKWQLAFNVKPPTTPTKSPVKEASEQSSDYKEEKHSDNEKGVGYLTSNKILSGTKLLILKSNIFHAASISNVAPNKICGIRFKNGTFSPTEIQYYSEQDLIRYSVLEREIINGINLKNNTRVAVAMKGNVDTFLIGTVVDFRNGLYVIQMDKGGFEETNSSELRILPSDYPKNKMAQENSNEKSSVQTEHVSKHKHKHNILLGYDFVDENDTDIVAWDKAISRRRKLDKSKSASPPLPEAEIKQEADLDIKSSNNPETETCQETKETINAEVNQSVQSMLDQVSLEDRMRISLLSNMLKKHSPKKEVNTKQPGNKSPKQVTEVVKKEKKRKGSKDSISKRLSLEDEDLSSELISICKESNIDISKQETTVVEKESVQLENKIEEIVEHNVPDEASGEDKLTIDEKDTDEIASSSNDKLLKKKKKKQPSKDVSPKSSKKPTINNGFTYVDSKTPPNWYIMVKKRADGVSSDTYYYTPCNTKLRSVMEIKKFISGKIKSKPMKKVRDVSTLPTREMLCKEEFDLTKEICEDLFSVATVEEKLIKTVEEEKNEETETKESVETEAVHNDIQSALNIDVSKTDDDDAETQEKDHVFKVPSLESFRSQKSKSSSKLPSPNCTNIIVNECLEDIEETPEAVKADKSEEKEISGLKETKDLNDKEEIVENKKVLRSRKVKHNEQSSEDDNEGTNKSIKSHDENTNDKAESTSTKKSLRSSKTKSNDESSDDDAEGSSSNSTVHKKEVTRGLKRKTRSQSSNSSSESENEDDKNDKEDKKQRLSLSETSGSENEGEETNLKTRKKRLSKKVKEEVDVIKEENNSDKENDNLGSVIEKMESEQVNGKHPKVRKPTKKGSMIPSEANRRSLRSNLTEEKHEDKRGVQAQTDLKEEDVKSEPVEECNDKDVFEVKPRAADEVPEEEVKEKDISDKDLIVDEEKIDKDLGKKKRKASDEACDTREVKKIDLAPTEKPESKNVLKTSKKNLGPKSKRKSSESSNEENNENDLNSTKKLLGPKSKRKSTGDENENEEDKDHQLNAEQLEQYNNKLTEATINFFKKKKHPKCNVKMFGLFQKSLCKAKCGHCEEVGKYTLHLIQLDLPQNTISMECTSCNWTTVRRMTVTTKVIE